jgi:hypothetical protein
MGTFDAIVEHVRGDSSNADEIFRVVDAMVLGAMMCGVAPGAGAASPESGGSGEAVLVRHRLREPQVGRETPRTARNGHELSAARSTDASAGERLGHALSVSATDAMIWSGAPAGSPGWPSVSVAG